MKKLTIIILLCILFFLIGWLLRGYGESQRIDDEAHRRLTNFVLQGVKRGVITISTDVLYDDTNIDTTVTGSP